MGGAIAGATSTGQWGMAGAGGFAGAIVGIAAGRSLDTSATVRLARQAARKHRDEAGVLLPVPRAGGDPKAPSSLLPADQRIAPWRGRGDLLAALHAWCADPAVPLAVVSGPAGAGKTRLIVEFAARGAAGWTVLRVRNPTVGREAELVEAVRTCGEPTVIVVDLKYDPGVVAGVGHDRAWLVSLLDHVVRTRAPVKILLECRGVAWQDVLRSELREHVALLDEAARVSVLPAGGAEDLRRWLDESIDAVCEAAGVGPPVTVAHGLAPGATMLVLQLQAIATAFGGPVAAGAHDGGAHSLVPVAKYLRDLERATWQLAGDETLSCRTVSMLTLVGASHEQDAALVLRRVPDLADADDERLRTLARQVRTLYPAAAPGDWIGGIEPDLVAQALHAFVFAETELTDHLVSPPLTPRQTTRVLRTLVPALPSYPSLDPVLRRALGSSPLRVVPQAIATALYLEDVQMAMADRLLAAHLDAHRPSVVELDAIKPWLADHLIHTQAVTAQGYLDHARREGDTRHVARALEDLGFALDRVGRYDEALATDEEKVALYRDLAAGDPAVHHADLARALTSLGVALGRVGRYDEALATDEESVALYRDLAAGDPAVHQADLALALRNLGGALDRVGRYDEALATNEESVALYRDLAAGDPAVHQADLARALTRLGSALDRVGRYDEGLAAAADAVALSHDLVASNPAVHRADLALALRKLGVALARVGRHDEALAADEEAVALYRDLAAGNPAVHQANLTSALRGVSIQLGEAGRYSEALAVAEDAVTVGRHLTAVNAAVHQADLAVALRNLGVALDRVGRHDEALAADQEAVALYRDLAAGNPAVHQAKLALALGNTGVALARVRRHDEALAAYAEAVTLYREVTARKPDVHHANLAWALRNLGIALEREGQYNEALAAFLEAAKYYRTAAVTHPAMYEVEHAECLRMARALLLALGRDTDEITLEFPPPSTPDSDEPKPSDPDAEPN